MKFKFVVAVLCMLLVPLASAIDVQVNDVTIGERSATISWNTDVSALGIVEYGEDQQNLDQRDDSNLAQPSRFQRATLGGLRPDTTYFFKVTVIDFNTGNSVPSTLQSFTTRTSSDSRAPDVRNVEVSEFGPSSTKVSWETNEPSDAVVHFGSNGATTQQVSSPIGIEHSVTLPTAADLVIDVIIQACDLVGNCRNETTEFMSGAPVAPPTLGLIVPDTVRTNVVRVEGGTRPLSTLRLFVDGTLQRTTQANRDGTIDEEVLLIRNEANISVESEDNVGNIAHASATVRVDATPPSVTITPPPEVLRTTNVFINGTTNENARVRVFEDDGNKTEIKVQDVQAGDFEVQLSLVEGEHDLIVEVADGAGNTFTDTFTVTVDNLPPRITNTNLVELSPTFIPDIKIRGTVSEPATVLVFVKPTDAARFSATPITAGATERDGDFSIDLRLPALFEFDQDELEFQISAESTTDPNRVTAGTTPNGDITYDIKLVAIDRGGHNSTEVRQRVEFTQCSAAGPFVITADGISPDALTPSLIVSGTQQIGIPINISYRGINEVDIQRVVPRFFEPSRARRGDFDHNMVRINSFFPPHLQSNQGASGFINFQFLEQSTEDGFFEKVEEISEHRMNDCFPGTGCAKFLLLLEIDAQEKIPQTFSDPNVGNQVEDFILQDAPQRTCIPITMMIDRNEQLGQLVPSAFLEQTAEVIESIVDGIDTVIQPITQLTTFVTYGCLLMQAWLYVDFFFEKLNCEWASFDDLGSLTQTILGKNEILEVASIGKCEEVYGGPNGDGDKEDACNKCMKHKKDRKEVEQIMKEVCDRVACPSAPTLQKYIKDQQVEGVQPVAVKPNSLLDQARSGTLQTGGGLADTLVQLSAQGHTPQKDSRTGTFKHDPNYFYSGSSCGFPGMQTGFSAVKEIYENYRDDDVRERCGESGSLRPADPECCGIEYMEQWDSACGGENIGAVTPINFDEIKESVCLGAQKANRNKFDVAGEGIDCGGILNAVAGFCTADGFPSVQIVDTGAFLKREWEVASNDQKLYIFVQPLPGGDEEYRYNVFAGFAGQKTSLANANLPTRPDVIPLNSVLAASKLRDLDTDVFSEQAIQEYEEKGQTTQGQRALEQAVEQFARNKIDSDTYKRVMDSIGASNQEYIVQPDQQGILRSAQCLCLPSTVGYLQQWREILNTVGNCMNELRLGGGSSASFCQDFLSVQACDMVYDAVSCFSSQYGPGKGTDIRGELLGGVGSFMGAITSAGTEMQRGLRSRYGGSEVWKGLYGNRNLVHSICGFAFTGQWDLDVDFIVQNAIEQTPLQTQGTIISANRRFITYNPATRPSGLTTWNYHFNLGIVAGADLQYQLDLICSNTANCDPAEGFKEGKCDCFGQEPKRRTVIAPELRNGNLKKNEVLATAFDFIVQEDTVRYDRAELSWIYRDPKTNQIRRGSQELLTNPIQAGDPLTVRPSNLIEQNPAAKRISQQGTSPYDFCQVDPFDNSFRCDIGIGDYTGARFAGEPTPRYNPGKDAFTLQEDIQFDVEVAIAQPSSARREICQQNSFTKYLMYEVRNSQNVLIATNVPEDIRTRAQTNPTLRDDVIPINTVGNSVISAPARNTLKVTQSIFTSSVQSTIPRFNLASTSTTAVQVSKILPQALTQTDRLNMVITLEGKGSQVEAHLYEGTGNFQTATDASATVTRAEFVATPDQFRVKDGAGRPTTSARWGFFFKDIPIGKKEGTAISDVRYINDVLRIKFDHPTRGEEIEIDIRDPSKALQANDVFSELRVIQNRQSDLTNQFCTGGTPSTSEEFSARFFLVDSQKPANSQCHIPNFNQITTDANTGERAEFNDVKFNVVCSDKLPFDSTTIKKCQDLAPFGQALGASCFCGSDSEFNTRMSSVTTQTPATVHNCGPGSSGGTICQNNGGTISCTAGGSINLGVTILRGTETATQVTLLATVAQSQLGPDNEKIVKYELVKNDGTVIDAKAPVNQAQNFDGQYILSQATVSGTTSGDRFIQAVLRDDTGKERKTTRKSIDTLGFTTFQLP